MAVTVVRRKEEYEGRKNLQRYRCAGMRTAARERAIITASKRFQNATSETNKTATIRSRVIRSGCRVAVFISIKSHLDEKKSCLWMILLIKNLKIFKKPKKICFLLKRQTKNRKIKCLKEKVYSSVCLKLDSRNKYACTHQ